MSCVLYIGLLPNKSFARDGRFIKLISFLFLARQKLDKIKHNQKDVTKGYTDSQMINS